MRLIVLALATVVALAACTEQAPPAAPAGDAPAPTSQTPPAAEPGEPASPAPTDDCGAAERQDWIGRARSALPPTPPGAVWRVFETGQPVTMDYSASRLNIEIDPASQTVVRLSCG